MELPDSTRALRTTRNDVATMNFVRFPYEQAIFDFKQEENIASVLHSLKTVKYQPSPCLIADVPKGKGAVRPGAILSINDQLAYSLLIDSVYPTLHDELIGLQGVTDFGYQLHPLKDSSLWFRNQFKCWDEWKFDSLEKLDNGFQFVVITDVTGFYENIDHRTLFDDLRRMGTPPHVTTQLRKCLQKWSQISTKGLPQSVSASHLLAKLYMSSIDSEMNNLDFTYTRFVDDIRIFCNSMADAKRALIQLSAALRKRGLSLQSSKTKILLTEDARGELAGKAFTIERLQAKLKQEVNLSELDDNPYAADIHVNTTPLDPIQLDIIKQAFDTYFLSENAADFDKTLFHYLIKRLGNASDDFAVGYCLDNLEKHPEETSDILKYFSKLHAPLSAVTQLMDILTSPNSVYDYQNYQICSWLFLKGHKGEQFTAFVRKVAFDNNKPLYYRATCKQILGEIGGHADLLRIQNSLIDASSQIEKNAIICSLRRLELGLRNSLFADAVADDPQLAYACEFTRQR